MLEQEIGAEQAEEDKLKRAAAAAQAQLQRIEAQLTAVTEKTAVLAPAVDALDEREHAYRSLQTRLDIEKQLHDMLCKQEQLATFLHSYAQAADNARKQLAELARDCDIQTEQINRIEEEKKRRNGSVQRRRSQNTSKKEAPAPSAVRYITPHRLKVCQKVRSALTSG